MRKYPPPPPEGKGLKKTKCRAVRKCSRISAKSLFLFLIFWKCCWFSHDVIKIQTTTIDKVQTLTTKDCKKKLSILPRFYFDDVLEQLKTNFHTNFRFKRVLGFLIEYAWISKLLRDAAFTCTVKKTHFREFCYLNSSRIRKVLL